MIKLLVKAAEFAKATAVASVLTVRLPPVMCMLPAEFNLVTTAVEVTEIFGNDTLPTRLVDPVTVKLVKLPKEVIPG